MKLLITIVCSFILLAWPMVAFMSVMLFDAPGSLNEPKNILIAMLILFYPTLFGLIYFLMNESFWWFSPRNFLIISIALPIFGGFLMGYPRLLSNSLKGIPAHGYFIKDGIVYYSGKKIEADSASFNTIGEQFNDFGKDKSAVFFHGLRIASADPETFTAVPNAGINLYRDKNHVYYDDLQMQDADPEKIRPLIYANTEFRIYFADDRFVFYEGQKLIGLDGKTAVLLSPNYVRDQNSVFFLNRKINGADANTFKILDLNYSYAVDQKQVYYQEQVLDGVKPENFRLLANGDGYDGVHTYRSGKKID